MTSGVIINIAVKPGDEPMIGTDGGALGFGGSFAASIAPAPLPLEAMQVALETHMPMPMELAQVSGFGASPPPPLDLATLVGSISGNDSTPGPVELGSASRSGNSAINVPSPQLDLALDVAGSGNIPVPAEFGSLAGQSHFDNGVPTLQANSLGNASDLAPPPQDIVSGSFDAGDAPAPKALDELGTSGKSGSPESKRSTRS